MNTDRAALLWGTVIAITFVVGTVVVVFKFPHFRLPFSGQWVELGLVSALLLAGLVHVYEVLCKRIGFWLLLLALLALHVTLFAFVVFRFTENVNVLRESAAYAVAIGAEVLIFSLAIARIYHVGPKGRPFIW
jgi:hypothetical protein